MLRKIDLNEYQSLAAQFSLGTMPPCDGTTANIAYPLMGLVGEVGEIASIFKRIDRDNGGVATNEDIEELKFEIGDVLWYIADLCTRLEFSLQDVADWNIRKLEDRQQRGVICGRGGDR